MKAPAIIGLEPLERLLDQCAMTEAARNALMAHARGEITSPKPGQLVFDDPFGDCHVKISHPRNGETFVVKVATGFYANPSIGLPVNNGLVILCSAKTGQPLVLFLDEGWLTSWRTAAIGAVASAAGARRSPQRLGIVGAGHQAKLQAGWVSRALGGLPIEIWARNADQSSRLASELSAEGVPAGSVQDLDELFAKCDAVVSCTAAQSPIVKKEMVRRGTHIVSLGADGPGKSELESAIFQQARVAVDDYRQCLGRDDFNAAASAGFVSEQSTISLGDVVAGRSVLRKSETDITIATLTGLGAVDHAIAEWAWHKLA